MITQIIKVFNQILTFFKRLINKTDQQHETLTEEKLNSNLESKVFITPDILENNNFKVLLKGNGIHVYSGINRRLVINNSRYFDGWDWTLDYNPQTGSATSFGRIRYVHELQQVLENNHIDTQIKV